MRSLEPLQVHSQGQWPQRIEWRGRSFAVVEVLATWCIEGRWWQDPSRGGARRRYFRLHLQTAHRGEFCVEVFRTGTGEWMLWRVTD